MAKYKTSASAPRTVRLLAAGQKLTIPVADGDGNGLVRAWGRGISDGTDRNFIVQINGSATNVTMQRIFVSAAVVAGDVDKVGNTGTYGNEFDLVMHTSKNGALRRSGLIRVASIKATDGTIVLFTAAFHFRDSTTTITSIDLDCGFATGLAAGSEVQFEEIRIG